MVVFLDPVFLFLTSFVRQLNFSFLLFLVFSFLFFFLVSFTNFYSLPCGRLMLRQRVTVYVKLFLDVMILLACRLLRLQPLFKRWKEA